MNDYEYAIAVFDSDILLCDTVAKLIIDFFEERNITPSVMKYDSCLTLKADIENGSVFHLVFLDVTPESFEFAKNLQSDTCVIFMSDNGDYAALGYEVGALRYLFKPLQPEKLYESLSFFLVRSYKNRKLLVPTPKGIQKLYLDEMLYAEASSRGVNIVTKNGEIYSTLKVAELEEMLPSVQFFRCHRAFIVNFLHVNYVRCYETELENGKRIPISKHRYLKTKKSLAQYLEQ